MNTTNRNLKEYAISLSRSVAFWTTAMMLFSIFRYYAIADETGIIIDEKYTNLYDLKSNMISFGLGGFLSGIFYATIEFFVDKFMARKIALGLSILIKIILIYTVIIIISDLVLRLSIKMIRVPFIIESGWWFRDKSFHAVLIYIAFAVIIYTTFTIVSEKFGKIVFSNMLIGRYKTPKETKQIFMFIDLKSSTTIAEQLGHYKYSAFIQDFFYDLNEIIELYGAKIYQYIGDEVVLTWPYERGIHKNNCVNLFYAFQNKIKTKTLYYLEKYNTVPEFKAGIHGGKLMVAEVGVVKKELAYHGDVINTAARIQALCNTYNAKLLISEAIIKELHLESAIFKTETHQAVLRGKQKGIQLYALQNVA